MRSRHHAATSALALLALSYAATLLAIARAEEPQRAALAAPQEATIDLAKLFDAVVEAVERRFVDVETLKRIDWRSRAQAARPAIVAAISTRAAVERINALLSELNMSHTALYTPDDYQYAILLDIVGGGENGGRFLAENYWGVGPYYPGVGMFTRKIGEQHFIDGVMEGSPAEKAGLKFGDEILAVDGAPYSPIAAFRNKIGETVALDVRRVRDAAPERVDVAVIPVRPTAAFAAATRASARIIEKNGRRIGYIHVWSSNEAGSFRDALARLTGDESARRRNRQAGENRAPPPDALIVDMRGRVGGNTNAAEEMLDALDDTQKPYWGRWRAADRSGESRRGWGRSDETVSLARSYRGRSALLIDGATRSAGEIMAYGYQRSGFGTVIGTRTAGAVTAGAIEMMPSGLVLYVAVQTLEFENGRRLEGDGVAPDQAVERPLPYAAGADPVLDAAVERLSKAAP